MKQLTIDVVIPTYNSLPYLKEALDSVLAQTYPKLEIYVIDDGSTDNGATKKYVDSIGDPRIHYRRQANAGPSAARNLGIKISGSPYVAFLDADDIWHETKLEKQLGLFAQRPSVGLVYGLCRTVDKSGKQLGKVIYHRRGKLFAYLLSGNWISGSASMAMVRREVFDKIGLFREDLLAGEDWEMWLRIARDYEIDCLEEEVLDLRILGTSAQRSYNKMAKNLGRMFSVVNVEFSLGFFERRKLKAAISREMALLYMNAREYRLARYSLWRAIYFWPATLIIDSSGIWLSYTRIVFGNSLLRSIRRRVSSNYRAREKENAQKS